MTKCSNLALSLSWLKQIVEAGLAWLGSVTNSKLQQVRLGTKNKLDIHAELGLGLEGSGISKPGLSSDIY